MTDSIIDQLASAVAGRIIPAIPLDVDLWSTAEIAAYLKLSRKVVGDHIVAIPGFPQPIRLPNGRGGHSHPRWKAGEVVAWAEKYQERRAA